MPIYTRTGDKGETSLFGGKRVPKSDPIIEACGALDELSSFIGLCAARIKEKSEKTFLTDIQKDIYNIMGGLAGAKTDLSYLEKRVVEFEQKIDEIQSKLSKLNRFILPGGTEESSFFHITRAVARRCEISLTKVFQETRYKKQTAPYVSHVTRYINRLSDLFFIYGRMYAKNKEVVT